MSCASGSNKIAALAGRLGAGIAQLAGKRGFYAGLALGGVGLAGAGLVALARRRSAPTRSGSIPQLAARLRIEPSAKLTATDHCAGCQTPAQGGKAGPWYQIEARAYCQDCAPATARQVGVDLAAPKVVTAGFSGQKGAALSLPSASRPIIGSAVTPLPVERRVETRLAPSRLKVFSGRADEAGRAIYIETNGYAVTRPAYRGGVVDTGLAITPGLKQEGGRFREDPDRWHIIHITSGITLPGQYGALEQAHYLAGILAQVDWTRPQAEFSTAELRRVGATISGYHEALAKLKPAAAGETVTPAPAAAPTAPQSLTGQLVADPKGGVGRIIEDNGATLFMVDARGERYEVGRHEIRPPSLSDYEGAGVAQAFDPATQRSRTCAHCGQLTDSAPAGSKWHIMSYQVFCGRCGPAHAKEEGYALADEIGVETA